MRHKQEKSIGSHTTASDDERFAEEALQNLFTHSDKKRKGTISADELEDICVKIGLSLPREEIDAMIKDVASSSDKRELNFEDFKKLYVPKRVRKVFDEINGGKSNFLTASEIKEALRTNGWQVTDNQVQKILKHVDKDGNGVITFKSFASYFQQVPALDIQKVAAVWLTSHSQLKRLRDCFDRYDANHDGFLNVNELNQAFHQLGLCLSDPEVQSILCAVQMKRHNEVNYAEFLRVFDVTNLKTVFSQIDSKGDGKLDFEEVKYAFMRVGWDLTDNDVMNLITSINVRGKNKIDFEEFMWAFDKLPLLDLHALSHYWLATPVLSEFEGTPLIPFLPNTQQVGTPTNYSIAAAAASVVSRSVTNPLERIKIVIQTQSNITTSPIAIAREIIAKEGYLGLWRGTVASAVRTVPFAGVVGALNGFLLDRVPDKNAARWRFVAIGTAASVASTITYPLDLIRTRMCLIERPGERGCQNRTIPALMDLVKAEGLRGAYRGLVPTLLATPLFISLQQTSFEVLVKNYKMNQGYSPSAATTVGIGLLAGVFTQTVLFPLEVVRHRMQVQNKSSTEQYKGTFHALKTIVVKEGFRGLFRGMWPAYLRVAPNAAISLFIREAVLDWLDRKGSQAGHLHEHHHHTEQESKHLHNKHHHTGDDQALHSPHAALCHGDNNRGNNVR